MTGRSFLLADRPIPLDDKANALLTPEARDLLRDVAAALAAVEPWTTEATEGAVRSFAERRGAKLGAVAQPLRAALTGRTTSPGIFEVLTVLGKAESLARLADQAVRLSRRSRASAEAGMSVAQILPVRPFRLYHRLLSCSAHEVALRQ